jgi:hypothetical protein
MAITYQHLLLLALLLTSPVVARAAQAAEGPATVPRFEPAPCPKLRGVEWLADASCGYLVVPEDRSRPSGRTIRLMNLKAPNLGNKPGRTLVGACLARSPSAPSL